jgi:hypothetical protein
MASIVLKRGVVSVANGAERERAAKQRATASASARLNDLADDGRLNPAVAMRKGYTHKCLRQQIRIFEQLRQRRSS